MARQSIRQDVTISVLEWQLCIKISTWIVKHLWSIWLIEQDKTCSRPRTPPTWFSAKTILGEQNAQKKSSKSLERKREKERIRRKG